MSKQKTQTANKIHGKARVIWLIGDSIICSLNKIDFKDLEKISNELKLKLGDSK